MGAALVKTAYVPVYTMDRVEDPQAEIAYLDERIASLAKRLDALYEHTLEESGEEAAELIGSGKRGSTARWPSRRPAKPAGNPLWPFRTPT